MTNNSPKGLYLFYAENNIYFSLKALNLLAVYTEFYVKEPRDSRFFTYNCFHIFTPWHTTPFQFEVIFLQYSEFWACVFEFQLPARLMFQRNVIYKMHVFISILINPKPGPKSEVLQKHGHKILYSHQQIYFIFSWKNIESLIFGPSSYTEDYIET